MKALQERILKEGVVLPGGILKVDSFLNQQIDPDFMREIGEEFHQLFQDCPVTKVLTIEASGIAPALMSALSFHVPCVFAKKGRSANMAGDSYIATVHSYTYGRDYPVTISRKYLTSSDHVLIIDDFLANGMAVEGLLSIASQAHAEVCGVGICIEKSFQEGGNRLRKEGVNLKSLARISAMNEDGIQFEEES